MQNESSILESLNEYNLKVNRDMIVYLKSHQVGNERILDLISHIVNAHQLWLERIDGKSMTVKPFDRRPLDDLLSRNEVNFETTRIFILEKDLGQKIRYVNTKRQRFENTITEMLVHLFNHGSYHRGQINQLLVQEGKDAWPSDYIIYNRTELL
jgi:uncharacterized damage-inducible protein DinB